MCVQQLQGALTVLCGMDQGIYLDWVRCMEAQSCGPLRVTSRWPLSRLASVQGSMQR